MIRFAARVVVACRVAWAFLTGGRTRVLVLLLTRGG